MENECYIYIDFTKVSEGVNYYALIGHSFDFLEGFGENWHAAYDCLRSARDPQEGMLANPLTSSQKYVLKIRGLSSLSKKFPMSAYSILKLFEQANLFHVERFGVPLILVEFE